MDIIVHCKKIVWDTADSEAASKKSIKLPSSCNLKLSLDDLIVDHPERLEHAIDCALSSDIADILTNAYDFCVEDVNYSWEWDPASCLKVVKRDAAKVLKAWKKKKAKFDAVISDPKLPKGAFASMRKSYEAWLKKNLNKRGYSGYTINNKPSEVIAFLCRTKFCCTK